MSYTPQVTIGIPTYNQETFIRKTIDSCLTQTYPYLRIIVADDQSSDKTSNVVQSLVSDRLSYKRNETRQGRVKNYYKLLYEYAAGSEWYLNLDGDDYLTDNNFINHAIQQLGQLKGANVVFFQGNHDISKVKKAINTFQELPSGDIMVNGKDYFINYPRIQHFIHCATLYRYDKALATGFYQFDCLFSDFNSLSRLALQGNIILSSRKVAVWRDHNENESKKLSEENLHREISSLENISQFAEAYLTREENEKWLKEMKEYYKIIFIYAKSTFQPGWRTIRFIIRHWKFSWHYPKFVMKNILLMTKKVFTG